MTVNTTSDYWISSNALSIELNALGNPDYIQASCVSDAKILVYVKDVIGYDAGHNYRRWTLQAAPTVFNSHTAKHVYFAIPKSEESDKPALVVFPSEMIDIYGKNEKGVQTGDENYYYIFTKGIISESGISGSIQREWQTRPDTGTLSSDEAIFASTGQGSWWSYSSVDDAVTFLKTIWTATFRYLVVKTKMVFAGHELSGVTETETDISADDRIVTPVYMDAKSLSKMHDDKTDYALSMASATVSGGADVGGDITAGGSVTVGGTVAATSHIHTDGNITASGSATVGTVEHPEGAQLYGDLSVGIYNKGMEGAHVDFYGNAEFESIVARSFLEVPELRYNRTTITVGNKWQTEGAGIIEKVWTGDTLADDGMTAYDGIAKLKLQDGEIGAIAVDDKCQGVYHFTTKKNSPSTADSHDGNFRFAGFTTVYFIVKEIYTADSLPDTVKAQLEEDETIGDNQFFRYELRANTCGSLPAEDRNRWTDASHPQPSMNFAAYANATDSDRQRSCLTTTTYVLHLAGMTEWTYTQDNIQLIEGHLDGFSLLQKVWDKEKKQFVTATKELHGEGIATGNIYMWGSIDQFDREPTIVSQQIYFNSSETADTLPDGIIIADTHLSYDTNGWSLEPITPSVADRFVWQQWLYTYSDGTYAVSDIAFQSADPKALVAYVSPGIVSLAISDVFDTANPDAVSFDVTARILSGNTYIPITGMTAEYIHSEAAGGTMTSEYDVAEDGLAIIIHFVINGYVGVEVNGVAPDDNFITVTLQSDYGTATGTVTMAQNRAGTDGEQGERGYSGVTVRRSEWVEGTYYRNDSEDGSYADDGGRYLDEVSVTDLSTGEAKWYLATAQHNGIAASASNKPNDVDSAYWTVINDMRPLRTSYADIANAFINYLQVNQIQIVDDNGTPYGAFGGGNDVDYPLWFGGAAPDTAVTKVNKDGRLETTDGVFSGIVMTKKKIINPRKNAEDEQYFTVSKYTDETFCDISISKIKSLYIQIRSLPTEFTDATNKKTALITLPMLNRYVVSMQFTSKITEMQAMLPQYVGQKIIIENACHVYKSATIEVRNYTHPEEWGESSTVESESISLAKGQTLVATIAVAKDKEGYEMYYCKDYEVFNTIDNWPTSPEGHGNNIYWMDDDGELHFYSGTE